MGLDVIGQDLIDGIEDDEVVDGLEDVVAAAGEEVERDEGVLLGAIGTHDVLPDGEADEARPGLAARVVLDLDAGADLEEARDLLAVRLADAADQALEDLPQLRPRVRHLHHGVAERERRQHLPARDLALVDGRPDAAGVDEGEGRGALAAVGAVF